MKILNTLYPRNSDEIQMTPVSELPRVNSIEEESLLHIAQFINPGQYSAVSLTMKTFEQKVFEAVNNYFKVSYWHTHIPKDSPEASENQLNTHNNTSPFKEMLEYLTDKDVNIPDISLKDTPFEEHINYDFTVLCKYLEHRIEDVNGQVQGLYTKFNTLDCYFDGEMKITTDRKVRDSQGNEDIEETSESVNHIKNVDDDYCQMSIAEGNKISNTWVCRETGNLVVYGWLDSSAALNNKAIPSSYCVLEGNINGDWEIIGVQTVIPAKSITYVGFNALVHQGLQIRVRTGFLVGPKSSQYPNEQDGYDTLANAKANGFKCQIYSKKLDVTNE